MAAVTCPANSSGLGWVYQAVLNSRATPGDDAVQGGHQSRDLARIWHVATVCDSRARWPGIVSLTTTLPGGQFSRVADTVSVCTEQRYVTQHPIENHDDDARYILQVISGKKLRHSGDISTEIVGFYIILRRIARRSPETFSSHDPKGGALDETLSANVTRWFDVFQRFIGWFWSSVSGDDPERLRPCLDATPRELE